MNHIQTFKFSINSWDHLYSLQQAILHNDQLTGRTLSIKGRVIGHALLDNHDTDIIIQFLQSDTPPDYPAFDLSANQQSIHILGELLFSDNTLSTNISVDRNIFEELRKNLMEYADIEGIHIIVTLGIICMSKRLQPGDSLKIIQLDYAMKGDA